MQNSWHMVNIPRAAAAAAAVAVMFRFVEE